MEPDERLYSRRAFTYTGTADVRPVGRGIRLLDVLSDDGVPNPDLAEFLESGYWDVKIEMVRRVDQAVPETVPGPTRVPSARDVLRARRGEILQAIEEAGFASVRVFGSVARGTDTCHSDLDLLVTPGSVGALARFGAMAELKDTLTRRLGVAVGVYLDDDQVPEAVRREARPL